MATEIPLPVSLRIEEEVEEKEEEKCALQKACGLGVVDCAP